MYNKETFFSRLAFFKVTNKELSMLTGISTGNISDWKSGKSRPNIEAIEKVADALHCSIDFLLGRTPFTDEQNQTICQNTRAFFNNKNDTTKTVNGMIMVVDAPVIADIKLDKYHFCYESVFFFSKMLEVPVDTLLKGTGIGANKILPEESDYRIVAAPEVTPAKVDVKEKPKHS